MARTLDRTRDFAESHGDGAGEGRYHQDGLWFDAAGVVLPGQLPRGRKRGEADEPPPETSQAVRGDDQVDAQLNG